jgi:hypothetical protein
VLLKNKDMKAKIEYGMLHLIPENEQEEAEIEKWFADTYENYDDMCDFMVWVEEIGGDKEEE